MESVSVSLLKERTTLLALAAKLAQLPFLILRTYLEIIWAKAGNERNSIRCVRHFSFPPTRVRETPNYRIQRLEVIVEASNSDNGNGCQEKAPSANDAVTVGSV